MFLAHMPAGYLASKLLVSQFRLDSPKTKYLLLLSLFGSIFPDLDMFYFYLIDNRQHGHHSYWTHIPFYWISLLAVSYALAAFLKSRFLIAAATVFFGCILLHLSLDSFAGGGIQWLYPFKNFYISIFSIPTQPNQYWLWNYFLHWTALIELSILSIAALTFWKTEKQPYKLLRRQT